MKLAQCVAQLTSVLCLTFSEYIVCILPQTTHNCVIFTIPRIAAVYIHCTSQYISREFQFVNYGVFVCYYYTNNCCFCYRNNSLSYSQDIHNCKHFAFTREISGASDLLRSLRFSLYCYFTCHLTI